MANEEYRLSLQVETAAANKSLESLQRQFAEVSKQIVNGSNLSDKELNKLGKTFNSLSRQIKSTENTISSINSKLDSFGDTQSETATSTKNFAAINDKAANSLNNLSRIAQDAPFGFIGIQNNINPLLESFQRLKAETGSTSAALKSMVAGLAGPAGLGLAVGVASSLLLVFSKEIAGLFKNVEEANESLDKMRETAAKELVTFGQLAAAASNINKTTKERTLAVAELRKEYGPLLSNYTDEEILLGRIDGAYQKLIQSIQRKIAVQAMEEKAIPLIKQRLELQERILDLQAEVRRGESISKEDADRLQAMAGYLPKAYAGLASNKRELEGNTKAAEELDRQLAVMFKNMGEVLDVFDTTTKKTGEATAKQKDAFQQVINSLHEQIATAQLLRSEMVLTQDAFGADLIKAYESAITSLAKVATPEAILKLRELRTELYDLKQAYKDNEQAQIEMNQRTPATFTPGKINMPRVRVEDTGLRRMQEQFKENTKAAQQFANVMSSQLTNGILNAASAFAKGETDAQGFFSAIKNLVIEIGFLLAKMAILRAIQSSIFAGATGGATMIGGGGGMFGAGQFLGNILGLATGGIVTGPTLAMIGEGSESEAVLPLSQLENIMNNNGGGQVLEHRISGTDLVLLLNRTNASLGFRR